MTQHVREIMTDAPIAVGLGTTAEQAARLMHERGVGSVLVMEQEHLRGLITDRDLVVRVMAEGGDPGEVPVGEVCSERLTTVTPDDSVERAIMLMRRDAVRRLPVVEGDRPVGVVALGDLAVERDPGSALGEISTARPND